MFSLNSFIVLLSVAVVHINGSSKDKEFCESQAPKAVDAIQCCAFPEMFTAADKDACGMKKDLAAMIDSKMDLNGMCEPLICILKKVNMMANDKEVDTEKAKSYLKQISQADQEWKEAATVAAEKCFGSEIAEYAPSTLCQPLQHFYCVTLISYLHCPKNLWKNSENCKKVDDYITKCYD